MTGYKAGREFQQVRLGWGPAQQAFQDKKYDVWITTTMPPSPAISQLALTNKIRLLPLDKSKFNHPMWKRYSSQPARTLINIDPKKNSKRIYLTPSGELLNQEKLGILSKSLDEMTNELNKRIATAENYSTDLLHEIRNHLALSLIHI